MTELTEILIAQRLDALDAGDWRAFLCTDGHTMGLSLNAQIKSGSVLKGVCGYGPTLSEAMASLYHNLTDLELTTEYVVVKSGHADRRAVRWNGGGWKPVYEPDRDAVESPTQ